MENSRKINVMRNMFFGTFFQIISLVMGFVSRTFFIKILSEEYLGINSLFTNILTILSFAELGVGSAIVYNLYKPIADNDQNKINLLLKFYKDTYAKIGTIMLIVGLILVPFIPYLIKDVPNISENIYIIYVIFLLDTVVSYFFTYRTAIITADQKNYIVVRTTQIFKIIQIIVQIILLYVTHNYYIYIVLQLTTTCITYLYLSHKSKKMYPFSKKLPDDSLSKKERKSIFDNVKALFVYKIGSVVLNGTDSIIISKYIGLAALGLYSNYYLIVNALTQVLGQVFNAFTASIGNLIANKEKEKTKQIFNQLFYFTIFIFGTCSICLYLLLNDFIVIWLGEEYLLSNIVVFAIVLHFFVNGVQFSSFTYRQTAGLFKEFRWAPILASFVNIFLSIFLAKYLGLAGVFFATSVSRLITSGWIDPYIVYKRVFKKNVMSYFLQYLKYLMIVLLIFVACYFSTKYIVVTNALMFILKGIIIVIVSCLLFIIMTFKTKEFNDLKEVGLNFLKRIKTSVLKKS